MGKKEPDRAQLRELAEQFRAMDRQSETGSGVFGIESRAGEQARTLERTMIEKDILALDRGYEGNTRRCPRCGKEKQRYKGDSERCVEFECGEIHFLRSYYICCECGEKSYPLDEKLGLVPGREQGRLRKKLSMLAVIGPYNQAPQICETMFGNERHAASMRRLLLKEAKRFEDEEEQLEEPKAETAGKILYVQIDGHMCPTREERKSPEDQGFREAKAIVTYYDEDVAQVTKKRREILHKTLRAKITPVEDFRMIVSQVCAQASADRAEQVVILGDGAKWIWNLAEEILPGAVQILDFAHAKHYLYEYANIRFAQQTSRVIPWVKEQEDRLCNDRVREVVTEMTDYADLDPRLGKIAAYYENNASRMLYGTYRKNGFAIGSGAIESAGKQLAGARLKGAGMRWNVVDVNPLIAMRAAFLDGRWSSYWKNQERLAA
jgi:hypothetical protein